MIELGGKPTVEVVAALAIYGRESRARGGVWWIRGALPIFQVAGIALGRKPVKDSCSQLLVAFIALNRGMRAQKRKAVLVILHLLYRDIPSLHGVTLCAIGAHLAAMNIGVAIGAILADVCKDRLDMALDAAHFLVHPTQRIAGLVVIKFRNRAYGTPSRRGVAVLAGNG